MCVRYENSPASELLSAECCEPGCGAKIGPGVPAAEPEGERTSSPVEQYEPIDCEGGRCKCKRRKLVFGFISPMIDTAESNSEVSFSFEQVRTNECWNMIKLLGHRSFRVRLRFKDPRSSWQAGREVRPSVRPFARSLANESARQFQPGQLVPLDEKSKMTMR